MNDRLKSLYKTQILQRSKNPEHFGEMADASHVLEAYNPMCGDQYKLFLKIENGVVNAASFYGFGCAISKASTEVLTQRIIGKKLIKIGEDIDLFLTVIDPESTQDPVNITEEEELLAFAGTRKYPEREQCASLSWSELAKFVEGYDPL